VNATFDDERRHPCFQPRWQTRYHGHRATCKDVLERSWVEFAKRPTWQTRASVCALPEVSLPAAAACVKIVPGWEQIPAAGSLLSASDRGLMNTTSASLLHHLRQPGQWKNTLTDTALPGLTAGVTVTVRPAKATGAR
jgi:hypothetical protein